MKRRQIVLTCSIIISAFVAYGQNSVGIGIANPNKNAVLELISPNHNQGLLIPKLTTAQRTATAFTSALTNKENGLMIFDSDEKKFYYWDTSAWKAIGTGSELVEGDGVEIVGNTISSIPQDLQVVGSTLTITNNSTAVPIDLSALNIPQDLELTGSTLKVTNNPAATPINLSAFTGTNTDDQVLNFDGATGNLSISRITGGPSTVNIPIPTTTPPSGTAGGDLSGSYPNPTVANNAINSGKIADGTIATADIGTLQVTNALIATGVAVAKLAPGTNGQVLTTTAGTTQWAAAPTATGTAGGDLTGSYPNPTVANDAINSAKIADNTVASADILDNTVASADITDNTITTTDINDGTIASIDIGALQVTNAHIATGVAVGKLGPGTNGQFLQTTAGATTWGAAPTATGTAGGELAGTYPNPTIANDVITSAKIVNLTIANADIATNAGIDVTKVAPGTNGQYLTTVGTTPTWAAAPTATGTAGGELTGTYPNPVIANDVITSAKIVNLTIADGDISNTAAVAVSKLAPSATNGFILQTSGGVAQWGAPGASVLIAAPGTRNLTAGSPMAGTTGADNTTFGSSAGPAAMTGSWNVYIGSGAGRNTPDGALNTMIGWNAGNATGIPTQNNGNTFVGAQAGQSTTDGPNTFIGEKAGQANVLGTHSVMIGNSAGLANVDGFQNTIIGSLANVSGPLLENATAIGYNTIVDASNKVRIGNAAVTVIQGQVGFTAASDRRLKSNIKPFENGLDLVMKLKPVSYNMKNSTDTRLNWGFIAQDIESLVGGNNAVLTVSGDKERTLGLRYTDFIAPLVKAVQQQQDQISDLNNKLSENEKKMELLMAEMEILKKAVGLKAEKK